MIKRILLAGVVALSFAFVGCQGEGGGEGGTTGGETGGTGTEMASPAPEGGMGTEGATDSNTGTEPATDSTP